MATTPVGLDDIGITPRHDDAIRAVEAAYRAAGMALQPPRGRMTAVVEGLRG
ncbi:hypothetical protein GWK16_09505 [Roseomonas sp. JC162]|uniref:Uncharacterized protein n=1 Tax=Neoroseomonas marina TaxID=1232220 RepID=A0A848EDR6_9PROT|nr:hypothetical protein [Neoroseomonas marina]NMJ41475.1 hypothetical protein [Neoroseomonas marina]